MPEIWQRLVTTIPRSARRQVSTRSCSNCWALARCVWIISCKWSASCGRRGTDNRGSAFFSMLQSAWILCWCLAFDFQSSLVLLLTLSCNVDNGFVAQTSNVSSLGSTMAQVPEEDLAAGKYKKVEQHVAPPLALADGWNKTEPFHRPKTGWSFKVKLHKRRFCWLFHELSKKSQPSWLEMGQLVVLFSLATGVKKMPQKRSKKRKEVLVPARWRFW